jgi:hypothetical protein
MGGGGDIPRSHINLHSSTKSAKTAKKRAVLHTFLPIKRRKRRFLLISTLQDILMRCFSRNTQILKLTT